ncbi:TolC family protein [bacterium]|nr:TolC family protein [bacterium]
MGKKLAIYLIGMLVYLIPYGESTFFQGFSNYLIRSQEHRQWKLSMEKAPFERKEIKSASLPHFSYEARMKKYSGVFDISDAEIEYLNLSFDADINLSRNIETSFTLVQNVYSGEKIYDTLRLHDLRVISLKMQEDGVQLSVFSEYVKALQRIKKAFLLWKMKENEQKQIAEEARAASLSHSSRSAKYRILHLQERINNKEGKYYFLQYGQLEREFLKNSGITDLPDIPGKFNFSDVPDTLSPAIGLLENELEAIDIKQRLNSDDFKPTIDLFFTYGLNDNDLWIFEDGYVAGMIFKWNIFDGFLYKSRNLQLERDKELIKQRLLEKREDALIRSEEIKDLLIDLQGILGDTSEIIEIMGSQLEDKRNELNNAEISMTVFLAIEHRLLEYELLLAEKQENYLLLVCEYLSINGFKGSLESYFNE